MTKELILPIAVAGIAAAAISCNSSTEPYTYTSSSSTQVTAFKLSEDENVLDSLQNVFFAIDQTNAQIFNADSLPYGTKVDKLIPEITVESTAATVQLEIPRVNMADSIVNFLENSTDSVDFSNGPVKLRIISESGSAERIYEIRVNVHTVKPDTLAWGAVQSGKLPSSLSKITAQKVVENAGVFYHLATDGQGAFELSLSANPNFDMSQGEKIDMPFEPNIESLRVANGNLFMLSAEGDLYESPDCKNWTATGTNWHYLYGAYMDQLLGCQEDNGVYAIASYPGNQQWTMPSNFPISGTSLPISYTLQMGLSTQMFMVGGITASGEYSSATWGFDGQTWAQISRRNLPKALQGMTVVEYGLFDVPSSTWKPEEFPAILAFGGSNADGVNRTVYYSRDWGMTWREAPELVQLPADMPAVSNASYLVYNLTMHASSRSAEWNSLRIKPLPPHCTPLADWGQTKSRVEKPITEWNCPIIYIYGGRLDNGQETDQAWRGAILRYTFEPKY